MSLKLTEAQIKLIDAAKANGGSIEVSGAGQKVTARKLMRLGVFVLVANGVYGLP